MKLPVLIPARNESLTIEKTVKQLHKQNIAVETVVIINGCTDDTGSIAETAGAVVLESPEGKTLALQKGLRFLGERALRPLILLDADSVPIHKSWAYRMSSSVENDASPVVGWGPLRFTGGPSHLSDVIRTVRSAQIHISDRNKPVPRTVHGANMAINMQKEETLEEILNLHNYWQRGDVAFHDAVIACGGVRRHILHPQASIETDGARFLPVWKRLLIGRSGATAVMEQSYGDEASSNTVAYTFNSVS